MAIVSPRAQGNVQDFPDVEIDWFSDVEHRRKLAEAVNSLRLGKIRSIAQVTLDPNVVTTALTDPNIGPASFIGLMPETSNAAVSAVHVTQREKGKCVLNHTLSAVTDRTFTYVVLG